MDEIINKLKKLDLNSNKILVKNAKVIQKCVRNYLIRYNILKNPLILMWLRGELFNNDKIKKNKIEIQFGNRMLKKYFNYKKNIKQWTTRLGEGIVKALLEQKNHKVSRPFKKNGNVPDWETDEFIFEVKTRNYSTVGTAGEKILGVPYKYADVPKDYKKPLKIVLVAYQEYEAINKFKLFDNNLSKNKKQQIKLWKEQNITFVKCTDLIKN